MKKSLALLLAMIMVLSAGFIVGCNGDTDAPDETTTADDPDETTVADPDVDEEEDVEIRVSWWGDTDRHNLYNQIVDEFENTYPHITTQREPVSWGDYWDKMTVQTAGDSAPDFIGMHPQFASDYLRRDVLEPLDPYIEDGTIDLSDFSQGAIESGMADGVVYMVAMGLTLQSYVVDETLLTDYGVTVPDFDWTWSDVETIAAEAREALDNAGETNSWLLGDGSGIYQLFRYWTRQRGGDLNTEDGDLGYTQEQLEEWFSYWKNLRDQNLVPDAATSVEFSDVTLEDGMFARDRLLVTPIPANQYKLYVQAKPEHDLNLIRNPSLADGANGEFTEGAHFAVYSQTTDEKKLAAAKLIDFWVNTEESISLFRLDQGVPANVQMAEFLEPELDEDDQHILDYVNTTAALGSASPFPPAGASEVNSLFEQLAERVQFDDLTPAEAAEQMLTEGQRIIDDNR